MLKKFWDLFDLRSDSKWLNIALGGAVSLVIAWSAAGLLFDKDEKAWTIAIFAVLWGFLIYGEYMTAHAKKIKENPEKKQKK